MIKDKTYGRFRIRNDDTNECLGIIFTCEDIDVIIRHSFDSIWGNDCFQIPIGKYILQRSVGTEWVDTDYVKHGKKIV